MGYGFFFPVFIGLLIPLLVILIVMYARTAKLHNLLYVLSVFSYVNLIIYWIDAFELKKNSIIALLVLSAVIMVFFGLSLAKSRERIAAMQKESGKKSKNGKVEELSKNSTAIKWGWIIPLGIIVILAFAGMFDIGFTYDKKFNSDLKASDFLISNCSMLKYDDSELVTVLTMEARNDFIIPRKISTQYTVCTQNPARNFDLVIYDGMEKYYSYSYQRLDIEVSPFESKNIVFKIRKACDSYAAVPVSKDIALTNDEHLINITSLYLIENDGNYVDCNALTKNNLKNAIVIPVIPAVN